MSAKGQEDPGEDLASRVGAESPCSDMKRAAAKKLIERYFYQLTDGCGNPQCDNQYCASSGKVTNLTPNQAAGQAIQLFSQEARLCDRTQPSKVARTSLEPGPASLAKRLPVKAMNPTCSIEGTASKSDLPRLPSTHEALSCPVEPVEELSSFSKESETREAPESQPKVSPKSIKNPLKSPKQPNAVKKTVVTKRKRKASRSPSVDSLNENFDNSSGTIISESATCDECSSDSPSSVEIVKSSSFVRILDVNDVYIPKRNNNRNEKYGRLARHQPGKNTVTKNKNVKVSVPKKKSSPRRVNNRRSRGSQHLVRELLVLALYLRYLEAKRYSRMRDRRNNSCVSPRG